jgi:hypothetical protein
MLWSAGRAGPGHGTLLKIWAGPGRTPKKSGPGRAETILIKSGLWIFWQNPGRRAGPGRVDSPHHQKETLAACGIAVEQMRCNPPTNMMHAVLR